MPKGPAPPSAARRDLAMVAANAFTATVHKQSASRLAVQIDLPPEAEDNPHGHVPHPHHSPVAVCKGTSPHAQC
jgi:hypothetical protein